MGISFKLFYFSLLSLSFPYNKILRRYKMRHQEIEPAQKIIKDMSLFSQIQALCITIDTILTAVITLIFILNLPCSPKSIVWVMLLFIFLLIFIRVVDYLLITYIIGKRNYIIFLNEWKTQ